LRHAAKAPRNLVLSICLLGEVGRFTLCERFVIRSSIEAVKRSIR
jgi:hypothetical protein